MSNKLLIFALATLAVGAAEAHGLEYECDDGSSLTGYRIRVVELSPNVQEVIVLKKKNGSASLVQDKKLRRVAGSSRFEFGRGGNRMSFNKTGGDADGNWVGIFTIPSPHGGGRIVRAHCGRVETLTL